MLRKMRGIFFPPMRDISIKPSTTPTLDCPPARAPVHSEGVNPILWPNLGSPWKHRRPLGPNQNTFYDSKVLADGWHVKPTGTSFLEYRRRRKRNDSYVSVFSFSLFTSVGLRSAVYFTAVVCGRACLAHSMHKKRPIKAPCYSKNGNRSLDSKSWFVRTCTSIPASCQSTSLEKPLERNKTSHKWLSLQFTCRQSANRTSHTNFPRY